MALYSNVLRRKRSPMQVDTSNMRQVDGAQPAPPAPKPIAFSGAPASLSNMPRQAGNVMPPTQVRNPIPGMRAIEPGAGMGIDPRPKGPPPPLPAGPSFGAGKDPRDFFGDKDVGKGMDPAAGAGDPGNSRDDIDQMIRDMVADRLRGAGKADTAEEEALIRQQMAQAAGGSSVNARARAGAAGMASSGALQAQEGDIRRAAEMDALDQVLGLRRTEDQRSIENAMGAVSAEQGMRSSAANDELRRMALAALQAEMGLDGEPVEGGGGGVSIPAPITDALGVETEAPPKATAGSGRQVVSSPPAGFELYQTMSNGDQLWKSPSDPGDNSTIVVVKRGA